MVLSSSNDMWLVIMMPLISFVIPIVICFMAVSYPLFSSLLQYYILTSGTDSLSFTLSNPIRLINTIILTLLQGFTKPFSISTNDIMAFVKWMLHK
jgi:hypothetical protein